MASTMTKKNSNVKHRIKRLPKGPHGIELLLVQTATTSLTIVLRLESVHRLILALLGPLYEKIYNPSG